MERFQEEEEPEPYASITRLVSRIRISRDKATILLILYGWNQEKFTSDFLLSEEYASISSYFVRRPSFNMSERACSLCNSSSLCSNIGCGHYVCIDCFKGLIESEVIDGKLLLQCPHYECGKFISHDFIKDHISQEARIKYEMSLKHSQQPVIPVEDTVWRQVVSALKSSTTTLIQRAREELLAAISARKKELCLLCVMVAWRTIEITIQIIRDRRLR